MSATSPIDKKPYLPNEKIIEKLALLVEQRKAEQLAAEKFATQPKTPFKREDPRVGRNDPCPCGSGKKYKKCHGA